MRLFNNNISWHELPRLSTVEKHFHSLDISLNTSLRDYESFDLINKESLNHKYQLLKDVITKLEGLKKRKTYDKWIYNNLFEIAIKRKKYLSILFDPLYSKNLPVEDQFKEYFTSIKEITPKKYNYLFLKNTTFYDFKKCRYWGRYWVETVDPCHRDLTIWYNIWLKLREEYVVPPFFFWLETQPLPSNISSLYFIDATQFYKYEIFHDKGKVIIKDNLLNTNPDYEYLFIISISSRIFLIQASKVVRHASLSHGKPILGVGTLQAKEGIITQLSLESGHYLPSLNDNRQALDILTNLGFYLPAKITYYDRFRRFSNDINAFKNKNRYANKILFTQ